VTGSSRARCPGTWPEHVTGSHADRLVCGLCASWACWKPVQLEAFLKWFATGRDGAARPPLRADHTAARFYSYGRESGDIGACLDFAAVPGSGHFPGGVLVLAELDADYGASVLASMRGSGQWGAMSIGGLLSTWDDAPDDTTGDVWIREVSLVSRIGDQADPGALVIATGPDALAAWELLTGRRAAGDEIPLSAPGGCPAAPARTR
jgi:hypothetical protein